MKVTTKQKQGRKKQLTTMKKKVAQTDLFTEVIGVCMIGIAIMVLASLFTDQAGIIGEGIRILFLGFFGIGGYLLPFYCILIGIYYMKGRFDKIATSLKYMVPLFLILISLWHLLYYGQQDGQILFSLDYIRQGSWLNGGWVGALFGYGMLKLFGLYGTYILLVVLFGIWLLVATRFPIFSWLQAQVKDLWKQFKAVIPV